MAKKKKKNQKPLGLREIPPKSKRPKVTSIRTTKVNDPYIAKIYFKYTILDGGTLGGNGVLETLNLIFISFPGEEMEQELLLSNATYTYDSDEFCFSVQPTPNLMVNNFFNPIEDNTKLIVRINYVGEDTNGHPTSTTQEFNVTYNYPD